MALQSLLIAGYKQHELGIFSEKDPKLTIIKAAIERDLLRFVEDGLEWLVFTGNLGFEYWVLEIAKGLQAEYGLKLATIFSFENHGANWNEANQTKLAQFKAVDFIKYAYPVYENPSQFRLYNEFLLENTDGAYLFYDKEHETNLKYLLHMMETKEEYTIKTLTFDDLNEVAENFAEFDR